MTDAPHDYLPRALKAVALIAKTDPYAAAALFLCHADVSDALAVHARRTIAVPDLFDGVLGHSMTPLTVLNLLVGSKEQVIVLDIHTQRTPMIRAYLHSPGRKLRQSAGMPDPAPNPEAFSGDTLYDHVAGLLRPLSRLDPEAVVNLADIRIPCNTKLCQMLRRHSEQTPNSLTLMSLLCVVFSPHPLDAP